jgi:hypothetical protein
MSWAALSGLTLREPDEQEDAVDAENRIRTTSAGTVSVA